MPLLLVNFLVLHKGSISNVSSLAMSTMAFLEGGVEIDLALILRGGGRWEVSLVVSYSSTLCFSNVLIRHSSSLFWWRVITLLNLIKLQRPLYLFVCENQAREGKNYKNNFSTLKGNELAPLECSIKARVPLALNELDWMFASWRCSIEASHTQMAPCCHAAWGGSSSS